MNKLLLEPLISFNPIYPCITKDAEAGVYLDYLIKELYYADHYKVEILTKDIYKYLPFLTNIEKSNQLLSEIGFLSITKHHHSYVYSLNIAKYEEYMSSFRSGASHE